MSIPAYLKKGDKIAILCPASYINKEVDLSPAYDILRSWGLVPVIYDSVTAQHNQFAGTDELRAEDIQRAIDDPEIKAIIAGRGGYGSVRILDRIDFSNFQKNPKWLVGFSDITALHAHIYSLYQIPTIHGQMVKSFLDASLESLETLKSALFGDNIDLTYDQSIYNNRSGVCEGVLLGGNLSILHSVIASPSDFNYDGKILFIEDVSESHYNIDRMLWTLKRAGKLRNLKGLIVGGFTELNDSNPPFGQRYEDIIMDKVAEYNYPVAFHYPAGHIDDNRVLVFGKKVQLAIDNNLVNLTYL